jgi:hypothetical protein
MTKDSKLNKLDREMRLIGFSSVAFGFILFAIPFFCYSSLWGLRQNLRYDDQVASLLIAVKLETFLLLPLIGIILIIGGICIIRYLQKRDNLLKIDPAT